MDIAVAPVVHLEMVSEAAQQGLHVLCQKPIAPTLAQLRKMIEVCDEAGVRFMVNENCRFQTWFRKIKSLINKGAIGRPYYANMLSRGRFSLPKPDPSYPQHDLFVNMPLFVNYELGVHYLDTLRYLFGEADTVYAQMKQVSPYVMGEDIATIVVKLNQVISVVDMSWASLQTWEYKQKASWGEYTVEGEEGTLYLRQDGVLRLITDNDEERFRFPLDEYSRSYQATHQHFIDCLQSGVEFETSGPATMKTMELVFGAYDSAENERIYRVGEDLARLA